MNLIGGFGDKVMSNVPLFAMIMSNNKVKLTPEKFKTLYKVDFSPEGSNQRTLEDSAIYFFELFLADLDEGEIDGLSLQDLLVFISGADKNPPLGFATPLTIGFYDDIEGQKRRPWASTCALMLYIQRQYDSPEVFRSILVEALLGCQGFGQV
eukprot:gene13168-14518_t